MKPLQTDDFLVFPRKAMSLIGMEASITENVHLVRARRYYFQNPYFMWDKIKENEFAFVPFDEWAIARLASATEMDAASIVEFESTFVNLPLEVWQSNWIVASIRLRGNAYGAQWEGHAVSFATGRDAVIEIERALAAEPLSLASYELKGLGRGKIGWNGHAFLGEKKVSRPLLGTCASLDTKAFQFEFRIVESPLRIAPDTELTKRRFTDSWPPIKLLESIPNWIYAFDEEGRAGQDETRSNQRTTKGRSTTRLHSQQEKPGCPTVTSCLV